jgi:hypothetical protein
MVLPEGDSYLAILSLPQANRKTARRVLNKVRCSIVRDIFSVDAELWHSAYLEDGIHNSLTSEVDITSPDA